MQKIEIGHRANFRAKNKCFRQILFPVRAILRSINFRYADFNTDSADACILVMACAHANPHATPCHVMHRARALRAKMNIDRADDPLYSFDWI